MDSSGEDPQVGRMVVRLVATNGGPSKVQNEPRGRHIERNVDDLTRFVRNQTDPWHEEVAKQLLASRVHHLKKCGHRPDRRKVNQGIVHVPTEEIVARFADNTGRKYLLVFIAEACVQDVAFVGSLAIMWWCGLAAPDAATGDGKN